MKTAKFDHMKIRRWTSEEVRALVEEAKQSGITQEELAEIAGCTVAALQFWMSPTSPKKPRGLSRRALTLAELCVRMGIKPTIEEES